ncbi:MAG TPA: OsmC family protein [Candidatus Obscuribacterales bacterium]
MVTRTADAQWNGGLKDGQGQIKLGSGAFQGEYSFPSRFESGKGTNPEELIAAAHAGCFSMALAAGLGKAGFSPKQVRTTAKVHLNKVGEGFEINQIDLHCEAEVPSIDEPTFKREADNAKANCPVSKLYKGAQINLTAQLKSPQHA